MFNLRLLSFFLYFPVSLSLLFLRKTLKINWKMLAPLIKACWQRTTIITNNNNNSNNSESVLYKKKKKRKHKQQEQEQWLRRFIYNVQYKFVFIYYDLPFLQILQFKMRWLWLLRNWPTGHVLCCLFFSRSLLFAFICIFFWLSSTNKNVRRSRKQHTHTHTLTRS